MQLIAEKSADTPAHLFLDVGTQRIPSLCAPDRIETLWVLSDLGELFDYAFAFGSPQVCGSSVDRPLFLIRLRQAEQEPNRRHDREDQQYPSSPDFPVFCAHRTVLLSSNIVAKEHKSHKRYMPCSPKQHEFAPKRHSAGEKSMVKLE